MIVFYLQYLYFCLLFFYLIVCDFSIKTINFYKSVFIFIF